MSEITSEEWRDIPGFEGCYQVSSLGRVKSLARKVCVMCKGKELCRNPKETIMRMYDQHGYLHVHLKKDGKRIKVKMHRLVASVFFPDHAAEKDQVNHKNKDRKNNTIHNLEWCTHAENMYHRDNFQPSDEPF